MLGDRVDDEEVNVDYIEPSVNEDVNHFQKEPLKKRDFLLNTLAQFWRDRGAEALHLHALHRAVVVD